LSQSGERSREAREENGERGRLWSFGLGLWTCCGQWASPKLQSEAGERLVNRGGKWVWRRWNRKEEEKEEKMKNEKKLDRKGEAVETLEIVAAAARAENELAIREAGTRSKLSKTGRSSTKRANRSPGSRGPTLGYRILRS
jgi:hypothetical protein